MLAEVCRGAVSYKEIKERPVWPAVRSWLSGAQQHLVEQLAPERIELPNGRKAKIIYSASAPPAVAARIQDLYGVERNLTVGRARVPLVIQVLAPNHRPIRSPVISRASGATPTRRSRKSCNGSIRSTSGGDLAERC
jgi:ATP-dependent helicase HrpB